MSLAAKVREVIEAERKHRYPGVTDGLYKWEDLAPFVPHEEAADGSIVILRTKETTRPISRRKYWALAEETIWNIVGHRDGESSLKQGFVVAGGAPSELLMRGKISNDIDVFLVGQSREEAVSFVRGFGARLIRCLAGRLKELKVYRTVRCVTFVAVGPDKQVLAKIQLILRLYQSVSEVLHGFDLGASKVADDGERLYLTSEGRFAYEHGLNIVNPAVRRASYEHRLRKYWERGFGLALPDMCRRILGNLPSIPSRRLGGLYRLSLPFVCLDDISYDAERAILRAKHLALYPPKWLGWTAGARPNRAPVDPAQPNPTVRRAIRVGSDNNNEDYENWSHHIHEYRDDQSALSERNLVAALQRQSAALCAAATFAAGLDVTSIQPSIDTGILQPRRRLVELMDQCIPFASEAIDCSSRDRIRDIFAQAVCVLSDRLHIPFELGGLSETAFALSAHDGRVSPDLWYGPYLERPPVPQKQTSDLLCALLLPVLEPLVLSYVGRPIPGACGECRMPGTLLGCGDEIWCFQCCAAHCRVAESVPFAVPKSWSDSKLNSTPPLPCCPCGFVCGPLLGIDRVHRCGACNRRHTPAQVQVRPPHLVGEPDSEDEPEIGAEE
jgi:hypothetical protein